MSATWKTADGRMLEIKWMTSVHLIHSLNMQFRSIKHSTVIGNSPVYAEVEARGLLYIDSIAQQCLLPRQQARETSAEMCMMRAIIDTGNSDLMQTWNNDRKIATEEIKRFADSGNERFQKILFKFAEYRLTR